MAKQPRNAGLNNSSATGKITFEIAEELRRSDEPNRVAARRLDVSPRTIRKIRAGELWKYDPGPKSVVSPKEPRVLMTALSRVDKYGEVQPNGCIHMVRGSFSQANGRPIWKSTHLARLVLMEAAGVPPEGWEAAHLCHNRHCVNKDHLEWQSHERNLEGSKHKIVEGSRVGSRMQKEKWGHT